MGREEEAEEEGLELEVEGTGVEEGELVEEAAEGGGR